VAESQASTNNIHKLFLRPCFFKNRLFIQDIWSLVRHTKMQLSISVHIVKVSFNFWFRFNQETSGFLITNITVKKPKNKLWSNKRKNTRMNWIMRKVKIQEPVYSFCFGDQGEILRSKILTETVKVFLLAKIT